MVKSRFIKAFTAVIGIGGLVGLLLYGAYTQKIWGSYGAEVTRADAEAMVFSTGALTILRANGETLGLNVEVARTLDQMRVGLMYRGHLAEASGMLFLYPQVRLRGASFWMKNTFIPLDLLFIGPNSTIDHIHRHAIPHDEMPIVWSRPVAAVLEIPAGAAEVYSISVGDKVFYAKP